MAKEDIQMAAQLAEAERRAAAALQQKEEAGSGAEQAPGAGCSKEVLKKEVEKALQWQAAASRMQAAPRVEPGRGGRGMCKIAGRGGACVEPGEEGGISQGGRGRTGVHATDFVQ